MKLWPWPWSFCGTSCGRSIEASLQPLAAPCHWAILVHWHICESLLLLTLNMWIWLWHSCSTSLAHSIEATVSYVGLLSGVVCSPIFTQSHLTLDLSPWLLYACCTSCALEYCSNNLPFYRLIITCICGALPLPQCFLVIMVARCYVILIHIDILHEQDMKRCDSVMMAMEVDILLISWEPM